MANRNTRYRRDRAPEPQPRASGAGRVPQSIRQARQPENRAWPLILGSRFSSGMKRCRHAPPGRSVSGHLVCRNRGRHPSIPEHTASHRRVAARRAVSRPRREDGQTRPCGAAIRRARKKHRFREIEFRARSPASRVPSRSSASCTRRAGCRRTRGRWKTSRML